MTAPVLAADSITLTLKGRVILEAAYVDALPGRITALVGRSGAGKTTLFEIVVGRRRSGAGLGPRSCVSPAAVCSIIPTGPGSRGT
jgi:ABC-type hemin transport system ATPase subunit